MGRPRLRVAQILPWADAPHARTGRWPGAHSGPVGSAGGEHWRAVESALRWGWRGLPGGDSVARLLTRHGRRPPPRTGRGVRGWTTGEDHLARTLRPADAARRTGRS